MRPIHLAHLDKTRPLLVMTRELVRSHLRRVTVAPITSTVRGPSTEIAVGAGNGLDHVPCPNCANALSPARTHACRSYRDGQCGADRRAGPARSGP
jgi:mRNA interferase MazF